MSAAPDVVDYRAVLAKARVASQLTFARRRHEKWAAEMRAYGHTVILLPVEETTLPGTSGEATAEASAQAS